MGSQRCLSISEMRGVRRRAHLHGNSMNPFFAQTWEAKTRPRRKSHCCHWLVTRGYGIKSLSNQKRAIVIELINKFNDDLELEPTRYQFKITFEDNDSGFEEIMSYNDTLGYVERE